VAANDQILSDTQSDLFVTTFYGLLNPATGAMAYANAGHIPPFLCRKGLKTVEQLANTGMALGVLPGIPLDTVRTALAPGDYLVLYTDGVTEAHDASFNQFGSARLLAEAVSPDGAPPGEIHHRIRAAVADFVGSAPQADDLTLMVVGRDIAKGS
jgi:sigma-B regulation protein RsbU (phosphoserine phosphatase)